MVVKEGKEERIEMEAIEEEGEEGDMETLTIEEIKIIEKGNKVEKGSIIKICKMETSEKKDTIMRETTIKKVGLEENIIIIKEDSKTLTIEIRIITLIKIIRSRIKSNKSIKNLKMH
jgi:hypothetical protein